MAGPAHEHRRIQFGVFTIDIESGELLRQGIRVRLQERPFQLLVALLERPGDLVTREELRARLWPDGTFVAFDHGITNAVNKLRTALRDSATDPQYVETVGSRGYRFLYPVSAVSSASSAGSPAVSQSTTRRRAVLVTVGLIASAVAVLFAVRFPTRHASPTSGGVGSIAVLPLRNLSADPGQEYIAEGLTDELITRLASLDGLRVISRTSAMQYKGTRKPLPAVARELRVDAVVDGSVLRSGGRVKINAQLVEAATDRLLWARSYDRDDRDLLDLQNDVARDIAESISRKVSAASAARSDRLRPRSGDAYQTYLRARYRWYTRRGDELMQAIEDFQRVISLDPNYALAYAGLADVYLVLPLLTAMSQEEAYPKAEEAAGRALALDPLLPEAHTSSAYARLYLKWDFAGAERGFRRAIELNPNYATAHQWYAELLSFLGRHDEGVAEIRKALELDPLSAVMHHQAGQTYQQARRYDEAIQEYRNASALNPEFLAPSMFMGLAYRRLGQLAPAAEAMTRAFPKEERLAAALSAAARQGDMQQYLRAERNLAAILARPAYYHGLYDAALGNDTEALRWLEKALERRDECILYIKVDPEWDRLRSDPRFRALAQKVGLS